MVLNIGIRLNTNHESALREEMVGGLSDVSGVDEVVIGVAELGVALLETRQEIVQHLRTYLSRHSKQTSIQSMHFM